jgi:MFS family permease
MKDENGEPDSPPEYSRPDASQEYTEEFSGETERPASALPTETLLEEEMPGGIRADRDPYLAFRTRSYLLFSIGALISAIGNQMQNVAVGWEIYNRVAAQYGHSPEGIKRGALALGIVGLIQALPVIFLALPAGQMADRYDRRRIVLGAQLLLAACWVGLAYVSFTKGPLAWFYFFLLLDGIANALTNPARTALIPQLIPVEVIPNASMWNSTRYQIASTLGPALGGAAIAFFKSPSPVYLISISSALIFMGFVLFVRPRPFERVRETVSLENLLSGARFVWSTPIILATVTLDMFAVLLGGAVALLPVFAKDILNIGPEGYGKLLAAQAVGALVMTIAIAHLPPMKRAGKSLLMAVVGFGFCTIVFGLSRNFYLSFAALFLCGAFDAISVVVRHTLVQVITPDHLRGRVSAINSVFIGISNEMGSFESGLLARFVGPIAAVVLGGAGTVGVALGVGWRFPVVRRIGSLEEAAHEYAPDTKPAS